MTGTSLKLSHLLSNSILCSCASGEERTCRQPASTSAACLTECLRTKRARKHPRRVPSTAPAPSRTISSTISSPSSRRRRPCVLARCWRHLWKFTTGLRIINIEGDDGCHGSVQELRKFVDHLLNLRGHTQGGLNTFEINFSSFSQDDVPYVNRWTRFAVLCRVRALTLHLHYRHLLCLDGMPLVSRDLRTLDLLGVSLQGTFLDFSGCPALKDLKMDSCHIDVDKISSLSLKHLSIDACRSNLDHPFSVSLPRLISLTLGRFEWSTPLFEIMPVLETASVELGSACSGVCHLFYKCDLFGADGPSCVSCLAYKDGSSNTMLLGAICNAKHLELIFPLGMVIFARDLKSWPTFNKLKTLLLSDYWCAGPDYDALTCILKHSPVLEKLTLQLVFEGQEHQVEIKESYSSMERSTEISEHLKLVCVNYNVVDDRVLQLFKFLCKFNIRFSFEEGRENLT